MTNLKTKRFVITGIRYQMPGDTMEERTQNARRLVENMPLPSQVYLKREPDNAWSRNAIAVYWKFDKLGGDFVEFRCKPYEECLDNISLTLLDEHDAECLQFYSRVERHQGKRLA